MNYKSQISLTKNILSKSKITQWTKRFTKNVNTWIKFATCIEMQILNKYLIFRIDTSSRTAVLILKSFCDILSSKNAIFELYCSSMHKTGPLKQ